MDVERFMMLDMWMQPIIRQAPNVAKASTAAEENSNLPAAAEVLKFQLQVNTHADMMLHADDAHPLYRRMYSRRAAEACRDSCLLACEWGYIPPLRLSVISRLVHPDHVQPGACDDVDCRWAHDQQPHALTLQPATVSCACLGAQC